MAEYIDVCIECGSPQNQKYAPGSGRPCGWCGGSTTSCRKDKVKEVLARINSKRLGP